MAEVLLTHSNHVYSDPKQTAKMQPYPPLQTILAAAVLEQHGIDVALFDPALVEPREGFLAALALHDPRTVIVCEDDFNFLSKMCTARNRELAFWMAQTARQAAIRVVAHGSDSSDHAAEYLAAGFDAVAVGEPEQTLMEAAQGRAFPSIDGLVHRCAEGVHFNAPRRPLACLDALPLPAWHLVNIERYRSAWNAAHGRFALNLASSRGCPYRCNWCAKPIYGNAYRAHSPQRAAAEMLELKRRFAPDRVWFTDDIFALSPNWAREFAAEVRRSGAYLPFKMQSRCDLMTRDSVAALREAGCEEVWMGAESGSQRILNAMDKDLAVEEIYAARRNLRVHGIRACFFLQFGYPGETWSDIEATIRMVRETEPDDIGVSVSYPLPGTRFHQIVGAQIGAKQNWMDSADVGVLYSGEFSTPFYRALAAALHAEVRGETGLREGWRLVDELRTAELGETVLV